MLNANKNFTLVHNLTKAISIMDDRGRANQEYNSYMLWFDEWAELRSHIYQALETVKRCEVE